METKSERLKNYHWICGSCGGTVSAKNIKEAAVKAFKKQFPEKPNEYDKEYLYFNEMKVKIGKLPKYW